MSDEYWVYPTAMQMICAWRESRGTSADAQRGQIHSVLNRVARPGWWGTDVVSVITKHAVVGDRIIYQYSCFNPGDPNSLLFPSPSDPIFQQIADMVMNPGVDPTSGATHYIDQSLWDNPPTWAKAMQFTTQLGKFRFFK